MPGKVSPLYKRIVLKISGEGFCRPGGFGLDADQLERMAREIREVSRAGVQVAVVVGGGNFLRGSAAAKQARVPEATAHHMGMLATVINAVALQDVLEAKGTPTRVLSAIGITSICEPFIQRRAIRHLEKGRVIILAGGTGNPYFTTDTCAALRAAEIQAEVLIKATKVDGVYSADPFVDKKATLFTTLTFTDVLQNDLKVMDHSAITLCKENHIDIVVCNLLKSGTMAKVACGDPVGTRITQK